MVELDSICIPDPLHPVIDAVRTFGMKPRMTPSSVLSLCVIVFIGACSGEPSAKTQPSTASSAPMGGASNAGTDSTKAAAAPAESAATGIYDLKVDSLAGESVDMSSYVGKVSLVVNVASECGYTRQYDGLQKLHEEMGGSGFQVLGFPCNDFGGQEPGSAEQISSFCRDKFGVTFPMFAKVKVKGEGRSPVYDRLIAASGKTPGWNFCKYLVGKDGQVLKYWASGTGPDSAELRDAIREAL